MRDEISNYNRRPTISKGELPKPFEFVLPEEANENAEKEITETRQEISQYGNIIQVEERNLRVMEIIDKLRNKLNLVVKRMEKRTTKKRARLFYIFLPNISDGNSCRHC
jgi:hypothetical protein